MSENPRQVLARVQEYRKIVLLYEALDEQIDNLIMAHHGIMENMSAEDIARYRDLARKRDDMQNQMRVLERELSIDDEA